MALLKCPDCGKDVSDKAAACLNCGCPVEITQQDFENDTVNEAPEPTINKRKPIFNKIIGIAIILIAGIGIAAYFMLFYVGDDGRYAVKNAQSLKNMMKDPDSFSLYDDVLTVWYIKDGDVTNDSSGYYTYINYGGKNSYGAINREIAIFKGYSYVGTMSDIDDFDRKIKNSDNGILGLTDNEREEYIKLVSANLPYLSWQLGIKEVQESMIIDKGKVMRNVK